MASNSRPTTHQADLTKLPRALAPLVERPQWCIWRWTQLENGRWQKPPLQAADPRRHASTDDPSTWSDFAAALARVQAGDADGITFILTKTDPFAAIDQEGVGELVRIGIERGRKTRPKLEVGICGEHGGDPSSVEFCHKVGMDYVSCSPFRVLTARLAAAQAAASEKLQIDGGRTK